MSSRKQNIDALPYLTADLPGVGGVIKRYNEDFVVEEIPLYEASGEGTHVYFTMEKEGLTTPAAIRLIAQALGRPARDIGYAGLKDAHAVTRQTLSLEHVEAERIEGLDLARIKIIGVTRHRNKIKLGHLAGNRFTIRIRDAAPDAEDGASAIVDVLTRRGTPNYFGPQRFGARGDNALVGRAALLGDFDEAIAQMLGRPGPEDTGDIRAARERFDAGDFQGSANAWPRGSREQFRVCRALIKTNGDARKAWRAIDHSMRKLYVFAVQSALFNRILATRIDAIDRLENGDIAWKHRNGACFQVENAAVEQSRCAAFEISPTGPLFGRRMTEPDGRPGQIEEEALAQSGLKREQLRAIDGSKLDGARRPLRVPLADPVVTTGGDDRGPYLQLSFALPPGAYATGVTREICKT